MYCIYLVLYVQLLTIRSSGVLTGTSCGTFISAPIKTPYMKIRSKIDQTFF